MNNTFFTPKTLGDAIGVSQSSLKRWADKGLLVVESAPHSVRVARAHFEDRRSNRQVVSSRWATVCVVRAAP